MSLLIKNGIIGDREKSYRADLLIDGERIAEVAEQIVCDGCDVVDAEGCYVVPGGIDPHTHVMLENAAGKVSDGFRAATEAAILGGTTTIVEHPAFVENGAPLFLPLEKTLAEGSGNSFTDFGIHMVFQRYDAGVSRELEDAVKQGFATGKVYLTYDGKLSDEAIFPLMEDAARLGCTLFYHSENNAIATGLAAEMQKMGKTTPPTWPVSRPDYCEAEAVNRVLSLARSTGALTYIVHLSTAAGLEHIILARKAGQKIYAETCPQYLCLTDECYSRENGLDYVMAPPLRTQADCDRLWKAIGNGDIDTVGTDHCSFSREIKEKLGKENVFKSPGGIPGIETRMLILFSEGVLKGRISLEQFVGVTAANVAEILGVPGKGKIAPGMDADIAIIDPAVEKTLSLETLHQKVDYTPYDGMQVRGWPTYVWLRGKQMIRDGNFVADGPEGNFIKRFI